MSLEVTNTPVTGYDDLDRLNKAQDELSNKMYENQEGIVNTQVQQNVNDIERNKEKLQEETTKANKGYYADYLKQINPYGNTAESLFSNGLGNSGVAESTRTNLYNAYQKSRTDTLNTARNLLADYNNEILKAKQNGDIQLAQYAQNIYNQKMNNLYQNYQLMQNAKQFDYEKERDRVADNKWQSEFDYNKFVNDRNYNYQVGRDEVADKQWQSNFDYNKAIDDRNYNYQVGRDQIADRQWQNEFDYNKWVNDRNYNYQVDRDKVSDSQWEKEYALSKKKSSSGSSKKSGSTVNKSASGTTGSLDIKQGNGNGNGSNINSQGDILLNGALSAMQTAMYPEKVYSPNEILNNISMIQGPYVDYPIKDNISGKVFASTDDLLAYYGYASVD